MGKEPFSNVNHYDQTEPSFAGNGVQGRNILATGYHNAKRFLQTAIIVTQVTPGNEAIRFAAAGIAIAKGYEPEVVGLVYGGTTLAIEGTAAVATADVLHSSSRVGRINERIDSALESRGVNPEINFSKITKAGIAFLGGTTISQVVKYREKKEQTKQETRRYGLSVASSLAGVTGGQGYLVAKGIDTPDMMTVGGAAIAIGGVLGIAKWTRNRIEGEE